MIIFSGMNENVVTSDDVAPKKAAAKKTSAKKAATKKVVAKKEEFKKDAVDGDSDGLVQDGTEHERPVEEAPKAKKSPVKKAPVAKASSGKKFVYFDSGAAYVTKEGIRFTRENRIYEIDEEEADFLLTLDNFRLPDQLELEEYYKENN